MIIMTSNEYMNLPAYDTYNAETKNIPSGIMFVDPRYMNLSRPNNGDVVYCMLKKRTNHLHINLVDIKIQNKLDDRVII